MFRQFWRNKKAFAVKPRQEIPAMMHPVPRLPSTLWMTGAARTATKARRKTQIAVILEILGFILFRSVWAFILFNGVSALDVCFWLPSWTSLVTEIMPRERRSSALGKLDAYGRAGAVPAPWLSGLLLERYGFRAPLYVQLASLSLVLLFVLRIRDR